MTNEDRISFLQEKHAHLDDVIHVLEAENAPDEIVTQRKKEKLHIKDEIEKLKKEL